ncbi:uncharacterized protein LOC111329787 [Stylophora pistillata]|nr:uncharacterized protein LOC111329787 [Stylophora pistillata]
MVAVLWFLIVLVDVSKSLKCTEPVRSVKGKYLRGHVTSNVSTSSLGDCMLECFSDPQCKSINFRFKYLLCELNDASRNTHPWDYISSEEHAYSDIHPNEVAFQSLHLNMTPSWLQAHASFIDSNSSHSATADQITFNAGSLKNAALFKVALVADGVLTEGASLTVEMTIAVNATYGQTTDSDLRLGVSDGGKFIGFEIPDHYDYESNGPCYGIQAKSGSSLSDIKALAKNAAISQPSSYPGLFFLTLKLDQKWGSCIIARGHVGGFNKTVRYTEQLMLRQGLTFEVYKSDEKERAGIKYVEVRVSKN